MATTVALVVFASPADREPVAHRRRTAARPMHLCDGSYDPNALFVTAVCGHEGDVVAGYEFDTLEQALRQLPWHLCENCRARAV